MAAPTTRAGARRRLALRITIALVALVVSGVVVRIGIAEMLIRSNPALAARIAPGDARIAVAAARVAISEGAGASDANVRALVGTALSRDATLVPAIELRAVDLAGRGDHRAEARLFDLSNTISRRSLPTRLWLIERSVDRSDVAGALGNFDIALRTSSAAPPILFPVLANAAGDPNVTVPVARLADRPSEWREMFLNYAVDKGDPRAAADLVLNMRDRAFVKAKGADRRLTVRLAGDREFARARQVYDRFGRHGSPDRLLADGDFSDPGAIYPFGWGLTDTGELSAIRSRTAGRITLSYRAESTRAGQVAAQLLMLPPGNYQIETRTASAGDPQAAPYWSISCGEEGGGQLARFDQPMTAGGKAMATFTVGAGCRAQWLTLSLRPSAISGGQSGDIASVSIARH